MSKKHAPAKRFNPMYKLTAATRIATVALAFGLGTAASAQQMPQLSLYSANQLLYNPAVAGMEDYLAAKAGYRQQNTSIADAPQTFQVNVHGALNQRELNKEDLGALPMRGASSIRFKTETIRKVRHGLGGYYVNDKAGQLSQNNFGLGYAIHIPFGRSWYFSGGGNIGMNLYQLGTSWNSEAFRQDPRQDPAMVGRSRGLFNLQLGGMLYNDNFYVGLSAAQLTQGKLDFGEKNLVLNQNKLNVHYFLNAGYRLKLSDELDLSPTALVKFSAITYAADLQARIRFRQAFFAGLGYRVAGAQEATGDGVTGLIGLSFNKLVDVYYSYDFTTSQLNQGSNGSHELTLGLRLYNAKRANPRIW